MNEYENIVETIPFDEAASRMGISRNWLHQLLKANEINGVLQDNKWHLYRNEVDEFLAKKNSFVSIYDIAKSEALIRNTLFDVDNRSVRGQLHAFLSASVYSTYLVTSRDIGLQECSESTLYIPSFYEKDVRRLIQQYIEQYGNIVNPTETLGESDYWKRHPNTFSLVQSFANIKRSSIGISALSEIISHCVEAEVTECTDADIERMRIYAEESSSALYSRYFVDFINYVKNTCECKYTTVLHFSLEGKPSKQSCIKPYSVTQYFQMSYMTYIDDYIIKNKLIEKALSDPQSSYVWLYVAMHYVCAWRKSDIEGLPILHLPCSVDEMLERIRKGQYKSDAFNISLQLQSEINDANMEPHKTKDRQHRRFLTIEIPTSLRTVFGLAYLIYCCHVHKGHYINKNLTVKAYQNFYGEKYLEVFGNVPFSNRRANKSFLDDIVSTVEKKYGANRNIMSTRVASFARAHVEDASGLSDMISRYLSCKLDGLNQDEILMLLFETGTCSFIPFFLLEIAYGEKFSSLNVSEQTQIMCMSGLDANKSELLAKTIDKAYRRSLQVVNDFFRTYVTQESKQEAAELMLCNIVNRTAQAKEFATSCLYMAKRLPCPFRPRRCFGCGCGIYELCLFDHLMDRVKSLYTQLEQAKTPGERRKLQLLLDDEFLPATVEILFVAKKTYRIDIEPYRTELAELITKKGELSNVSNNKQ